MHFFIHMYRCMYSMPLLHIMSFVLVVCVCVHSLTQMEQSEGQPQQRGFSFKAVFRRGPEVPIADRIAAAEKEMYALDQVCKEKRRQLRSGVEYIASVKVLVAVGDVCLMGLCSLCAGLSMKLH